MSGRNDCLCENERKTCNKNIEKEIKIQENKQNKTNNNKVASPKNKDISRKIKVKEVSSPINKKKAAIDEVSSPSRKIAKSP